MKIIKWSLSIALMVTFLATLVNGLTIDGTADADYGSAIVSQQLGTSTYKNTETNVDAAGGSELDAAYGTISNGVLYLVLAGNMDSGGADVRYRFRTELLDRRDHWPRRRSPDDVREL